MSEKATTIYVAETQEQVIVKLREFGIKISFHPERAKDREKHDPVAFIQPNGIISNCTKWKAPGHGLADLTPADAQTCIELHTNNVEVLRKLVENNLTVVNDKCLA